MKDRRGDIRLALPVGGRLTDPRFDFTEVIWSTVRHAAFKGGHGTGGRLDRSGSVRRRLAGSSGSRWIQSNSSRVRRHRRLTGRSRCTQLVAFLDQLPETRLTATAVLSQRDLAAMKQRAVDAAIEGVAPRRANLARRGGDPRCSRAVSATNAARDTRRHPGRYFWKRDAAKGGRLHTRREAPGGRASDRQKGENRRLPAARGQTREEAR